MTYALQNASLNGSGYQALFCFIYSCTIFRYSCGVRVPVQDSAEMPKETGSFVKVALFKVLVMGVMAAVLLVPASLLDLETVGSPIAIMFINIVIPGTISAILLTLGPYDSLVAKFHARLNRM